MYIAYMLVSLLFCFDNCGRLAVVVNRGIEQLPPPRYGQDVSITKLLKK